MTIKEQQQQKDLLARYKVADYKLRPMLRCRSDSCVLWLRLFAFRCRERVCGHKADEDDQISPVEHPTPFPPLPTTLTIPHGYSVS